MSQRAAAIRARVVELRRAFDESFSRPPHVQEAQPVLLLGVREGQARFAVPVEALAGVHPCGRIAALPGAPGASPALAGVRGRIYAVHRLAALLGGAGAEGPARWLLLARASEPIALAVEAIDAHLRADAAELRSLEGARPGGHVAWVLRQGEERLDVLSVPSLLAAIEQRAPGRRSARQV
jgi:purine-binding chemotaxis protein CheW